MRQLFRFFLKGWFMGITVGDIYSAFPNFSREAMIKLMNGRKDFEGKDAVPLINIARYKGQFDKELSIFTAKEEGKSFISLVSDEHNRNELAKTANISLDNNYNKNNITETAVPQAVIPMGTSVFDIAAQKRSQQFSTAA